MDLAFDGKVVLVTGASSGIGKAIALAFGARGARVAVNGFHHAAAVEETAEAIRKSGGSAIACVADVTARPAVDGMVSRVVAELGPVDVLVNNAGSGVRLCPLTEMTDEYWDTVLSVNLRSAFLCTRAVVPGMIARQSGAIVNVSSVVARHGGGVGELAYTAAKGGLSSFTRGLAKELAKQGIRANTLAPGPTDTPFHEGLRSREALESTIPRIPMGRLGRADEMVGAALFLASDAASFITGQSIEVNGGFWFA